MRPADPYVFSPESLAAALAPLAAGTPPPYVVALSGGVDSAALLVALAQLARADARVSVRALHIDHGLVGAAPLAAAARALAAHAEVALEVRAVQVDTRDGQSVEAAAREARYAAFAAALGAGECLLTAHHRQDQAETLLLQLLRGAGLRGLAAMPAVAALGAGQLWRPLLGVEPSALRRYAADMGVRWFEDPMNADRRYERGYLRAVVWPLLSARWPGVAKTLARVADHAAAAQGLLDEDSGALLVTLERGAGLSVAGLGELPYARRREVLRYWLRRQGLRPPATRRLARLEQEFLESAPDAAPRLCWSDGELVRHDAHLYAFAPLPALTLAPGTPLPSPPGRVALGELGVLEVALGVGEGLDPTALLGRDVTLGPRRGGERLRLAPRGALRPAKDWLREARIPPWARQRALFLNDGPDLVAIVLPGRVWIAAERRAAPGAQAIRIDWRGAPPALMCAPFIEQPAPFR